MPCGIFGLGLAPGCIAEAATNFVELAAGLLLVGVGVILIVRGFRLAGLVAAAVGAAVLFL